MNLPTPLSSEVSVSDLLLQIQTLLKKVERQAVQIEKLTAENTKLHAEIRHLKKLKGKPNIRPQKKDSDSDDEGNTALGSDNSPPPKGKRTRQQKPGGTSKPVPSTVKEAFCRVDDVQDDWINGGYQDFTHIDVDLQFVTTIYRREYWKTPEGKTILAPLPEHVKSRFGHNLKALILEMYHSCSVTQPLLLDWLHDYGCPISEGSLNNLLTENNELFHQEKDELLETGIACSRTLQVDDTGARHDGKNGVCTVIGNDLFTFFASTSGKSRINFLTLLQGQRRCHVLNSVAIAYMKQVKMAAKWVDVLSSFGEIHFLNDASWIAFLDDQKLLSKNQRRMATEGILKAGLLQHGFPESMVIHSDGARQFDTVFAHSSCWFHAGRPLAKLIPGNTEERAARDWILDQYWRIYDDIEAYCQNPTEQQKHQIEQDFNHWISTHTCYDDLRNVLGKLRVIRGDLLLILEHPWLPLHNNWSERQIREYVKRRKISGGTRSDQGQRCRDTFASLKKTCRQYGLSFSRYLKDRLSGTGDISRLSNLIRDKSELSLCGSA